MASHSRVERDSLGELTLPADVLYGINTLRGVSNFPIAGRTLGDCPALIRSLALVKQAAVQANHEVGALDADIAHALAHVCANMAAGDYNAFLLCNLFEGSGGTSLNMNINEVLANAALQQLGAPLGDYDRISPNDHVNLSQSTNDVVPTAVKLAAYEATRGLIDNLIGLADALALKSHQFSTVLRLGRTCLQDAQPMTLGQAFSGYEAVLRRHIEQLQIRRTDLLAVPLGGTAIGTGFGVRPGYRKAVFKHLSQLFGVTVEPSGNAYDGMQNMDTCARLSAEIRGTANSLWKLGNDLIILSSGPAGGLGEITLPAVQAGSSIMPGKVNPVIPMAVCQVALAVFGNDAAISLGAQQGLLDLNHYEMVIVDRLLDSIELLTGAVHTLTRNCVVGLEANVQRSLDNLMNSSALATALVPALGYAQVSMLVKESAQQGVRFVDLAIARGHLTQTQVQKALLLAATQPQSLDSL